MERAERRALADLLPEVLVHLVNEPLDLVLRVGFMVQLARVVG